MGYIRNSVLIAAPVDKVFASTNDVRVWPSLFTEYESCEVLEEEHDYVVFRLTTCPNEQDVQYSWVAKRQTNRERRSTYSERMPSSGPFEKMVIRWWYDPLDELCTVMTWEQEFSMKPDITLSEEAAIRYLNEQTRIQQKVIKGRIEQQYGRTSQPTSLYRGVIVGQYQPGTEEKIVDAFTRSDATELPHLLGVKTRHIWVQGEIYLHFVEGQLALPRILQEYIDHPLFKEVKAELDQYVSLIYPDRPPMAKEIYQWPTRAE